MKIAVLGWGSLLWKPDTLQIMDQFQDNGPVLPIEFCRISSNGRLTLVVDQARGTLCSTYHARSAVTELSDAMDSLRIREHMQSLERIGFVNRLTRDANRAIKSKQPEVVREIQRWTEENDYDATIWTALGMKFKETIGVAFSVGAAIRYLEGLDPETFSLALDYIRQAPPQIRTPVRDAVNVRWPLTRVVV